DGKARLCLGTHDTRLVARISDAVEPTGVPRSATEVHMLYGIRTDELARLRDDGYSCSSLVAYGEFWYAWYMRRLAERPANVVFALRHTLPCPSHGGAREAPPARGGGVELRPGGRGGMDSGEGGAPQHGRVAHRRRDEIADPLLLWEPPPVLTLG